MSGGGETIEHLEDLVAELRAFEPLPPESDAAWNDDEPWKRAHRLVALAEIIGERRWVEAVPLALSKMSLGDPGESMRTVMNALTHAAASEAALEPILLDALRSGPPGARFWAAQQLGLGSGDAAVVQALLDRVDDDEPSVRETATESLASIAAFHAEWGDWVRDSSGQPMNPDTASELARMAVLLAEEIEQGKRIEADALAAARAGLPIRLVRTVRRCGRAFRPGCPVAWDALETTSEPDVRRCGVCAEAVYFCATDAETLERAAAGACIARAEPSPAELPQKWLGGWRPSPLAARHAAAVRRRAMEEGIREVIASGVDERARRCPDCGWPVPRFRVSCYVCGHNVGRG